MIVVITKIKIFRHSHNSHVLIHMLKKLFDVIYVVIAFYVMFLYIVHMEFVIIIDKVTSCLVQISDKGSAALYALSLLYYIRI